MLFCFHRHRDTLQRALRAAVAAHRSDVVRELLAHQGEALFATGLAGLSARVLADALSMLPVDRRAGVVSCLPRRVQARYLPTDRQTAVSTRSNAASTRATRSARIGRTAVNTSSLLLGDVAMTTVIKRSYIRLFGSR